MRVSNLLAGLLAAAGLWPPAVAGEGLGLVQTLEGRIWQGDIQLAPPSALRVRPPGEAPIQVELTNLLCLSFNIGANGASDAAGKAFPPATPPVAGELPAPWRSVDIGALQASGRASWKEGTFEVESFRGTGRSWRDAFHFVCQAMKGDGEIVARVASLEDHTRRGWSQRPAAGLLMRANLSDTAASALIALRAGGGCLFRCWYGKQGRPFEEDTAALGAPHWLKLTRVGTSFTGYRSHDGVRWQLVNGQDLEMPEMVYVGLVLCSRRARLPEQTTFDHVRLRGLAPAVPFVPQIVLRDGTVITDPFESMDETVVKFSPRRQTLAVLTRDVAAVLFQELPAGQALPPDHTGVWLENGDFLDAKFQKVAAGRLEVASVLYGQRTFAVKTGVLAVVLQNVTPTAAAYEVKMTDGSVLRVSALRIERDAITLVMRLAGTLKVPLQEIAALSRGMAEAAGR